MGSQSGPVFPQEIWWLVSLEVAARRDFGSLFLLARLSKGMARLALPELYAIHDMSPAINAHILNVETSICLWRSIIISSLGTTMFPYCCWIKALLLGGLHSQLEDLSRDNPALKASFFRPPLEKLEVYTISEKFLDADKIVVEVAHMVTSYIRASAARENKETALAVLEGQNLPQTLLPGWVSGLSNLTTLSVRDGATLNADISRAIRKHCPAFKHVQCFFFSSGIHVDATTAGFFSNLKPQSLESFAVLSLNHIGFRTFQALNGHSDTLKVLALYSLERAAFERLYELQDCRKLEIFRLEGAMNTKQYRWAEAGNPVFQDVVRWLQKCTALWYIELMAVPSGHTLCAQILEGANIRPMTLVLKCFDVGPDLSASLTGQTNLRRLTIEIRDEDVLEADDGRRTLMANAISTCRKLRELDTNELFTLEEVDQICGSLPHLEEIVLNGECINDAYLGSLSKLRRLRSLNIFAPTLRMTKEDKAAVTSILWSRFKGQFKISYRPETHPIHFGSDGLDVSD
ncbi:uncharacterized protein C8A04DRAFT_9985 [Dichotomopilus funicola]|uniref:Uncharacterized protein n=1 Tax=Dichotomopilus funicola TaxID=1934379 RepID=A0AAN6ZQ42_9PEZI|nr:hypothetical protein C8A04DRAFT_9985 [Dichotomopilus funicola]